MPSFLVGTFNTPELFHLHFDSAAHSLQLVESYPALGNHSWLALSKDKKNLYATAWSAEQNSVASYSVGKGKAKERQDQEGSVVLKLLNTAPTRSRSGYVAVGESVLYSVGGPTGEVVRIGSTDGAFTTTTGDSVLQYLDFIKGSISTPAEERNGLTNGSAAKSSSENGKVLDFGGLRHGSHSIDLSLDGRIAYVADIGRNCIWVYTVSPTDGSLTLAQKCISPRSNDGPRHVWPHPNGKIVYVLQEHSCIVDVFEVCSNSQATATNSTDEVAQQSLQVELHWRQGMRIIPDDLSPSLFWADEVRLSPGEQPTHLLASTRGLEPKTKGYVALFALDKDGYIDKHPRDMTVKEEGETKWLHLWQTPTSGGWANAVETYPSPLSGPDLLKYTYAALTDSELGLVMVLQIKGDKIIEVARLNLGQSQGTIRGAATAVWL